MASRVTPVVTVEAAFSAASGDGGVWDVSRWDEADWGPDVIWSDITEWLIRFDARAGRADPSGHYDAAESTVVADNDDGRFSPENASSPYYTAGVSGVRPWRPLRITATYDGQVWPMFRGFVEGLGETAGLIAETAFTCVDGIALLARFDGYEQPDQGSGEFAGPRIHRVLDNAAWDGPRNLDVSGTQCQPTTLAQPAWTEVLLTADSDGGEVWQDPDGTFIFEDAGALFENDRSNTSQATFTDDPTGTLHYEQIDVPYDGEHLVNIAALARAGGTVQIAADQNSRALFHDHRWSREDLVCTTDAQVAALAARLVTRFAAPEKRVGSITLRPDIIPILWPQVLGRRIRDRVTVEYEHPSGTAISRECFIDGIEHTVGQNKWSTVFRLSSAEWIPNAAQLGRWDTAVWDTSAWSW